jgi:hypothetical protein
LHNSEIKDNSAIGLKIRKREEAPDMGKPPETDCKGAPETFRAQPETLVEIFI